MARIFHARELLPADGNGLAAVDDDGVRLVAHAHDLAHGMDVPQVRLVLVGLGQELEQAAEAAVALGVHADHALDQAVAVVG